VAVVPYAEDLYVDEIIAQRDRLLARLGDQRAHSAELWDWYRGRQQVPDVQPQYSAAYQLFLRSSVTPWARLVVDAIAERLRVQGVRNGEDPDVAGDAWRAFKRGRLDADQRLVYTEALITGTGYVSVSRQDDGRVRIVPESSYEVTHEPDLTDRQLVAGALKLYPIDYSHEVWQCELYRREATYRWVTGALSVYQNGNGDGFPVDFGWHRDRLDWDELDVIPNETDQVPVVPFENRINVVSGGASEIEDLIPTLQRIDRLTLDQMVASSFGSFRQKWATGLQVPRDPDTGNPIEPYKASVSRLWVNENPAGRFGTMESSSLDQFLVAIDAHIATLAAISRVPAHYLLSRNLANPPSAESLVAAESGLVAKCVDRQASYGEAWEQVLALYLQMSGDPVDIEDLEVIWTTAERRSPAIMADAAIKWQAVGVPQPAIWLMLGASPAEIEEWTREAAAAELLALATAQAAAAAPQVEQEALGAAVSAATGEERGGATS
jgi:hypothetical protein